MMNETIVGFSFFNNNKVQNDKVKTGYTTGSVLADPA